MNDAYFGLLCGIPLGGIITAVLGFTLSYGWERRLRAKATPADTINNAWEGLRGAAEAVYGLYKHAPQATVWAAISNMGEALRRLDEARTLTHLKEPSVL